MNFDISLLLTYGITFVVGVITGAFSTYFGIKYTERRQKKERKKESKKKFLEIKSKMPELISEMRNDLLQENNKLIREFYVFKNPELTFNMRKPRLIYYRNQHTNLYGKLDILENNRYIIDVTTGDFPLYRLSEDFVDLLLEFGE